MEQLAQSEIRSHLNIFIRNFFLRFIILLVLLLSISTPSHAQSMRVMTFNIDDTNRFDYDTFWRKVVNELIIPFNVELAVFQEVDYDCEPPQFPDEDKDPSEGGNGCNTSSRNEEEYLLAELASHPQTSSYKVKRLFRRMIMSEFDIISEDSPALSVGRNTPRFQSAVINSPSGPLRIFNVHWGGSCPANLEGFSISIDTFADKPYILGGDFNINYYDGSTLKGTDDRTLCFNRIRNDFTFSHPPNQTDEVIDYIMVPRSSGWETTSTDNRIFSWKADAWSDHNPVIATITYVGAGALPTPTKTPSPTPTPGGAATTLTVTRSRPKIEEMSFYDGGKWDELMYYTVFALGYLTLIRFGFYIHRFFSFFLLTLVFVGGLGITFAFGLPAGLFVVIMGSFMIMMQ